MGTIKADDLDKAKVALPERLTTAIKNSGLSHRDIERLTGIPHASISVYASGKVDKIPSNRLRKLASALDVTPEYLYGLDELDSHKGLESSPEWRAIMERLEAMPEDQVEQFLKIFRQQLDLLSGQKGK